MKVGRLEKLEIAFTRLLEPIDCGNQFLSPKQLLCGLPEFLPGLRRCRWTCLWLGLSRADRIGDHAAFCRDREGRAVAAGVKPVRMMFRGLPGQDPDPRHAA